MNECVDFTEEEISNFEKLDLNNNVFNNESRLFKIRINDQIKVLKQFLYCDWDNKRLTTINTLIKNKDSFDERFIIPEKIALYGDEMMGYIMRYVDNYNLSDVLKSNEFPISFKKDMLKQIGEILLYTDKIRKQNKELSDFYIGDLQTNNFMYDKHYKVLTVCDLDSCKISKKINYPSLYLNCNQYILFVGDKYPINCYGDNIINRNTDIYCYIMLILSFLYGDSVYKLGLSEYNKYLEHLINNGLSSELVDLFARIYSEDDNINPVDLIDAIPDDISKFHKSYCKFIRKN